MAWMSGYREQLTEECTRPECKKVFCRRVGNSRTAEQLSKILSKYKNTFMCSNIVSLLKSSKPTYDYPIIDIFFYVNSLIKASSQALDELETQSSRRTSFGNRKDKSRKQSKKPISARLLACSLLPSTDLCHHHCKIYSTKFSIIEKYILTGVTHLFLAQFHVKPEYLLALVSLRLFLLVTRVSSIDCEYFKTLEGAFEFVYNQMIGSVVIFHLAESEYHKDQRCLLQLEFCRADLEESVGAISHMLNTSIFTDIRENRRTLHLLQIFSVLYRINERAQLLDQKEFYLVDFCNKTNLRMELKYFRTGQKSMLEYPFVFPMHVKAELLKIEHDDTMKSTLQDAFFRSLFEGVTKPYLFITVRRTHIYEDTVEAIMNLGVNELKKQIKIKFADEDGVDSGGLKKEYFQLLSHEMIRDTEIFQVKHARAWLNPGGTPSKYRMAGKIIGLALYNDAVLDMPFPSFFFKKMLGVPLTFEDLAEIEPENFCALMNLRKCSDEELRKSDLYFVVDYMVGGTHCVKELVVNGESTQITKSNIDAFCEAYASFHTSEIIHKEFLALMEGFSLLIKRNILAFLKPKELERIIMGIEEINVNILEQNTTYTGYTRSTPVIRMFWDIFKSYDIEDQRKLLQFITGNDRIPVSSSRAPKLVIVKNGEDTERLPSSQTCFNTLLLPEYTSKAKIKEKLDKAIKMAAGFFLL